MAALLLASPLYAAPHRGSGPLRAQIEALEKQWQRAELTDDTATMDRLLSDDYLGILANGDVVTKLQQLDRMKTHKFTITKLEVSDVKIKLLSRQAAIVTSLVNMEGSTDEHPIHGSFRYTRVYQRVPSGAWKITSFEATRIHHHPDRASSTANEAHS